MVLKFTEEEQKYLTLRENEEYGFECSPEAPQAVRKSIDRKIKKHKEWIKALQKEPPGGGIK